MPRNRLVGIRAILIFKILLAVFLITFSATQAQDGKETIGALVKVFDNLRVTKDGLSQTDLAEAANYIDYRTMAERALGEKYWQKLSSTERTAYLQSFKSLIEKRYYLRWHRIFSESTIAFNGEERKNGNTYVDTTITTGKSSKQVRWTLTGERQKVINLSVDDSDLIDRVQKRFQRKLDGVGTSAFVAWLQKRAKQTDSSESDT